MYNLIDDVSQKQEIIKSKNKLLRAVINLFDSASENGRMIISPSGDTYETKPYNYKIGIVQKMKVTYQEIIDKIKSITIPIGHESSENEENRLLMEDYVYLKNRYQISLSISENGQSKLEILALKIND